MSSTVFFFIISLLLQTLGTCRGSLSDVTNDLFGGLKNGVVAAFGDFNADKLTDIFVLSDGKMVHLLQAEHDLTKERVSFSKKTLISGKKAGDTYISSLAPGDFNGDAMMDLLITRKNSGSGPTDPVTVQIYWGSSIGNTLDVDSLQLNETLRDQPSIVDVNGDMIPDLIGETSKGERSYFIFSNNRSYTIEKVKNGTSDQPLDPLRIPQSSAFFDFNGDLVPDLCMVSEGDNHLKFEIWLNEGGVLQWSQTIWSPPELKQFGRASFHDLNDNREMNIILPGCLNEGGNCSDSVVYVWGRGTWHNLNVDFKDGSEKWQFSLEALPSVSWVNIPLALRFGDFNLDGFPDAIAVLKKSNNSYGAFLMLNVASTNNFSRTFHIDLASPLSNNLNEAPVAAFYDFMENGILDVLLTVYTEGAAELRAMEQHFTADAYFLKVMVVSGLCKEHCANDHKPFGVNQVGPVIRFQTTTSTGDTEIGVASQLSQSAYFSLQLPFEVFGLGQTPNFVDLLEVGIQNPPSSTKHQRSWPSIIPNAQVVVIPNPVSSPSSWTMKLFVTPSRLVLLTGTSLLGTCAVIAVFVVLLHWRERVEDKKEKLQESQKFHFDAM